MLTMDISCQLLGDACKLKGFLCALRARGWEIFMFRNDFFGGLHMLIMDISCQNLGDDCNLENVHF